MSINKQTLINQATPDSNIGELQSSSPKLYRAIKNLGDVSKTIINSSIDKYAASFKVIAGTPLSITHNLGTVDVLIAFYGKAGVLLIPTSVTCNSVNTVVVTFAANQEGRVVIIG